MSQLRLYQAKDEQTILEAYKSFRSIIYQLPTGGGKSVIIKSVIQGWNNNEQIIVFAHKRKLLLQLRDHFRSIGIEAGVLAGQLQENLDSRVLIVSIRTAVKDARLQSLLERDWGLVVIDEARHSRTASYDKVLDALFEKHPNCKLLGVDATPYRKDKKRLDKHFQHMVVSDETTASLTEKGFLQRCKTIVSPINIEDLREEVKEVANDYQIGALSNYMRKPKFLNYVVGQYIEFGEERQALVFAVDKAHAKDLMIVFEDNGYQGKVARVDSDMSESEIAAVYDLYEQGLIQILINVEMITEGVDLPSAGCLIGARPTMSLTLFLQMAGRGPRLDGIHDYFILLDCCGWTEEYGLLTAPKHWSLNPEIDPNGARLGNKIFGRNKVTGELEEDLTDYIGEVIEMTPEEYLKNLQGGKEKAEQINITIDDKIKALIEAIVNLFLHIEGIHKDFYCDFDLDDINRDQLIVRFYCKGTEDLRLYSRMRAELVIMKASKAMNQPKEIAYAQMYSNFDQDRILQYFSLTKLVGDFNAKLMKENEPFTSSKTLRKAFEILDQVKDLKKSKINLDQFKEAEKQLKAEQYKQLVDDHAKINKSFDLTNNIMKYGVYFKESWMGNMGGDLVKLDIPNGKINNHSNTIIVHVKKHQGWAINPATGKEERTYVTIEEEKKYIKGERIFEMLKDTKWNLEVKS